MTPLAFANASAEEMDITPESWADSTVGVCATLAV